MITPETLTDEMIVDAFRVERHPKVSFQDAWFATSDEPESDRKRAARQRICDAINTRTTP